ncbi:MAG: uracil-DNA glycosylase [Staphylococcus sp.]|nr:uracil-DNA glycosylase [Staphylococcus sp.]
MDVRIEPSWKKVLADEWDKDYFKSLTDFVRGRYMQQTVFPPAGKIFAAFDACPFDQVKVVILGQDPYPGYGQANGLSFSVNPGVELPRSLRNIYRELQDDLGCPPPPTGDLSSWARQGVLLLNATLTVDAGAPASHQGQGWETFTDAAIRHLAEQRSNLVFILWGAYAQRKGEFIDRNRHCVITSPHPSPLSASRGFFGSRPFSRANAYLTANGISPVDWCAIN